MLLHVTELLKPSVTVRALVRLFAGMHSDVLHQLMIGAETLQALLALVGFHFSAQLRVCGSAHTADAAHIGATLHVTRLLHLHRAFVHKNLGVQKKRIIVKRYGRV